LRVNVAVWDKSVFLNLSVCGMIVCWSGQGADGLAIGNSFLFAVYFIVFKTVCQSVCPREAQTNTLIGIMPYI
jgi:hypothetical protein